MSGWMRENNIVFTNQITIRLMIKAKLSYDSMQTTRYKAILATLVRLEAAKFDTSDLVLRCLSTSAICERN